MYHKRMIEVYIEDKRWFGFSNLIREMCYEILKYKQNILSITLTNNPRIEILNKTTRNKDQPTDILSFPMEFTWQDYIYLGDIVLSYDAIKTKARASKITIRQYTKMIVIHGILHLLGYDHENDEDWHRMRKLETTLSEKLEYL